MFLPHWDVVAPHLVGAAFWFQSLRPNPLSPLALLCSEALLVAIQGRPGAKCDLHHVGQHARYKRLIPTTDRPPRAYEEGTVMVRGPVG